MVEILLMRELVQLWDSVRARDQKSIRERIRWISETSAVFESSREAAAIALPPATERLWVIDLDVDHMLCMRGWAVHEDRDDLETVEYLRSELIETALYFLETSVNTKLNEHKIGRPLLQYRAYQQLEWQHLPASLIGALWVQFADAIVTSRNFSQCPFCKESFEVKPGVARKDKLYCSQTCRTRAYRMRRIEARRLYVLGSTVEELAQRFDSDPTIVRRWL
jgi:hypothetical protein